MGYAIFRVVREVDTVGNRLKEVQESVQDLAKFGKLVELVSFAPFQGRILPDPAPINTNVVGKARRKPLKMPMKSQKELRPNIYAPCWRLIYPRRAKRTKLH